MKVKWLKKLSIVIPVYNSEKTIEEVVNEIEVAVSKLNSNKHLASFRGI